MRLSDKFGYMAERVNNSPSAYVSIRYMASQGGRPSRGEGRGACALSLCTRSMLMKARPSNT